MTAAYRAGAALILIGVSLAVVVGLTAENATRGAPAPGIAQSAPEARHGTLSVVPDCLEPVLWVDGFVDVDLRLNGDEIPLSGKVFLEPGEYVVEAAGDLPGRWGFEVEAC